MSADIFISYCHADAALISPIVKIISIRREDLVFQDIRSLKHGKKWEPQLMEALENAKVVIVFWCKHAAGSDYVQKEYKTAIEKGKDIWPLLLDDSELDSELSAYQWLDLREIVKHQNNTFGWKAITLSVSSVLVILLCFYLFTYRFAAVRSFPADAVAYSENTKSSPPPLLGDTDATGTSKPSAQDTWVTSAMVDTMGAITPAADEKSKGYRPYDQPRANYKNDTAFRVVQATSTSDDSQLIPLVLLLVLGILLLLFFWRIFSRQKAKKPTIENAAAAIIDQLNEKLPKG